MGRRYYQRLDMSGFSDFSEPGLSHADGAYYILTYSQRLWGTMF